MATVLAASCGTDTTGEGPVVDIDALQTGNYRTTPRSPEEVRTAANIDIQEALRLGEHVPLIMETNPKLVFTRVAHQQRIFTRTDPPRIVDNFSAAAPGFIAGWETIGQRREDELHGRSVDLTVMRFSTPESAAQAARALADGLWHSRYPPVGTIPIPGYTDAFGQARAHGAVSAAVARNEFVLWAYIGGGVDIPPDQNALADLAAEVFDAQFERLRKYEPTPEMKLADLPVDRDGLLSYALPDPDGAAEAVMSAHAALHLLQRPDLTERAFDDARVDLVVHGEPEIYRAGDERAADRLHAYFVGQLGPEYRTVDSPPGVPKAHCAEDPDSTGSLVCLFTVGRYSVIMNGTQIQDLHQKVSAQYVLLEQAP
ncbi:DUF7373 family lipoprotein [Nocardia testacea]|uniref:DUF7373 family lipoprotein n=1 Tax=Nocardia testacea TaxID=248551 RepID=UPI0012F69DC3|nr:hypothetical protein [Nocardia testacea]